MEFCDFTCMYAAWPEEEGLDGSGSCRTFQAVYCRKKQRHVHKNMPCPDKKKKTGPAPPTRSKGRPFPGSG